MQLSLNFVSFNVPIVPRYFQNHFNDLTEHSLFHSVKCMIALLNVNIDSIPKKKKSWESKVIVVIGNGVLWTCKRPMNKEIPRVICFSKVIHLDEFSLQKLSFWPQILKPDLKLRKSLRDFLSFTCCTFNSKHKKFSNFKRFRIVLILWKKIRFIYRIIHFHRLWHTKTV